MTMKKKNTNFKLPAKTLRTLEGCCVQTQGELFTAILRKYGKQAIACKGKFILVPGAAPVMLLAHMDTVHKERVRVIIRDKDRLESPQGIGGDDRCGIYGITKVWDKSPVNAKPWLLYTCDEEIGCIGAYKFATMFENGSFTEELTEKLSSIKFLVELDRKGSKDAVYYDCYNDAFEDYITSKGFKTEWGSCSDISYVAPALDCAAVNLSSGYYNAHTTSEYIVPSQLEAVIRKVIDIVAESVNAEIPRYEFIDGSGYSYSYADPYYDDESYRLFYTSGNLSSAAVDKLAAFQAYAWGVDEKDLLSRYDLGETQYYEYIQLLDIMSPGALGEIFTMCGAMGIHETYREEFDGYDDVLPM